jgi:hypothetical protein
MPIDLVAETSLGNPISGGERGRCGLQHLDSTSRVSAFEKCKLVSCATDPVPSAIGLFFAAPQEGPAGSRWSVARGGVVPQCLAGSCADWSLFFP